MLDALDAPVERIVITHMHPDHVGGARDVAELTGAPVFQGREDYAQCLSAWGTERSLPRLAGWWEAHGLPQEASDAMRTEADNLGRAVHFAPDPELLDPGDEVDGWRVELLRGHADGHIVLVRDGVLIAGARCSAGSRPRSASSRPTRSATTSKFARIEALDPRIARPPGRLRDPAGRARRSAHHESTRPCPGALGGHRSHESRWSCLAELSLTSNGAESLAWSGSFLRTGPPSRRRRRH